jgi:CDK-activating kinase assembly factor MAT1
MSSGRANVGGWLRGTVVRKGGGANAPSGRSAQQVQSTSTTVFGGGVKDPSGRTSEYFVSTLCATLLR